MLPGPRRGQVYDLRPLSLNLAPAQSCASMRVHVCAHARLPADRAPREGERLNIHPGFLDMHFHDIKKRTELFLGPDPKFLGDTILLVGSGL